MRKKVVILYGGQSVEHGVSVKSAHNIAQYIDRQYFEPLFIGITSDGAWHATDGVTKEIGAGPPVKLILEKKAYWVSDAGQALRPDVVLPVLHGTDGEDGSVQGLIRVMNAPMVGSGPLGSSLSMNKFAAKQMLARAGLPVAPFQPVKKYGAGAPSFSEITQRFGLPFMVKAANLGSSVGVSKVKHADAYLQALEEAFRFDDLALIEKFIAGREIECAILGNDPPEASLPGEIIISPAYDFYTFDAKYVDPDAVSIQVPAQLTDEQTARIRALSVQAFESLHCHDFARVDLFLTPDNEVFINEVNTIPGFTNSSMFPLMWRERGIGFTQLISRLIELAVERHEKAAALQRQFQSGLNY
jgi:D-alanine-D-alanine ligase